jgi:hypothetical protein
MSTPGTDTREAMFNERAIGLIHEVQLPAARITTLSGFMLDLDPKRLRPDNTLFPPADDPRRFYQLIRPVLARHPLARHAEVRASGTGLHAIVRLDPPVELETAAAQKRWAALVRAVQCTLPSDPGAPGLTALTRPIGSINSRNGAVVERLAPGEPVDPGRVTEFVEAVLRAPFKAVAAILLGADHVRPCPVCGGEGSRLDVLDRHGSCYGGCDRVTLDQLFDAVFEPPARGDAGREGAGTTPSSRAIGSRPSRTGRRPAATSDRE